MKPLNKKGVADISGLYQFVLLLVLIGMIMGVGILVLDNFYSTAGLSGTALAAIGNTSSAIGAIGTTWLGLLVTISVLAIILTVVVRSFVTGKR